jgi:hypothetical protein
MRTLLCYRDNIIIYKRSCIVIPVTILPGKYLITVLFLIVTVSKSYQKYRDQLLKGLNVQGESIRASKNNTGTFLYSD